MKNYFIKRPIFAIVISAFTVIMGLIVMSKMPIEQYPNIIPPMVQVNAVYPGADAKSVNDAVAAPLSENIIGVENMLYMQSTSSPQGTMTLNVAFDIGSNPDLNTIFTQNRVSQASASLPQSVINEGVITQKTMTSFLMVVALYGNERYSQTYLSNYAFINIRNELLKINGIGSIQVMGAGKYSMRVWLKPDRMDFLNISTSEITNAIKGQSGVFPVGQLGAEPNAQNTLFTYTMILPTPIESADQYGEIVIRTLDNGGEIKLKDVANIELGTQSYGQNALFMGHPTSVLAIYQAPGSNAVELGREVDAALVQLSQKFPDGINYEKVIDTTFVIKEGINEIVWTLVGVLALVILIIYLFIQNVRATLIPLLAIPVSLIGAFAFFPLFDLSINVFTLLGLVLAVGLVVDDAIVIVEAVQLNIDDGKTPYDATSDAMGRVMPAIIASTLTLAAVFLPIAFMTGIAGELFSQFALTIALSFILSGVNALTLTPALSMLILRKENPKKGWLFDKFNIFFEKQKVGYLRHTATLVKNTRRAMLFVVVMLAAIFMGFKALPSGFLPEEDQGYLFVSYALPAPSSVDQSFEVGKDISQIVSSDENVESLCFVAGYNLLSGVESSYNGVLFIKLKEWNKRKKSAGELVNYFNEVLYMKINRASAFAFAPPSIPGMGNASGFSMELLNTGNNSTADFAKIAFAYIDSVKKRKEVSSVMTQFSNDIPQKELIINKQAAMKAGIDMGQIHGQIAQLFGGAYIGNFNKFGQQYRTYIQADSPYRQDEHSLQSVYVINSKGESVPLSSFVTLRDTVGANYLNTFNIFPAISLSGNAAQGYSSGDAIAALEEVAAQVLPDGYSYTWSDVTYQEVYNAPNTNTTYIYIILFVFLILAALFENWALPLSIIFGIPVAVIGAVAIIYVTHLLNPMYVDDIFFQISMVLLIALSAKNAILIIEYAHSAHLRGLSLVDSAMEAATLRFRPILMTALSFILGVIPLVVASGPNAHSRNIIGIALLGGMLTATFIGIFLYPALFVFVNKLYKKNRIKNISAVVLFAVILVGCKVGPKFKSPKVNMPESYINQPSTTLPIDSIAPIYDSWWKRFGDPVLDSLVTTALGRNKNLAIAVVRVDQAMLTAKNAGKALLPSVGLQAEGGSSWSKENKVTQSYGVNATISWEIDIFGALRNQRDASRAEALSTQWASRSVHLQVVSSVIESYFGLLESESLYKISQQTYTLRSEMFRLVEQMYQYGAISKLDYNAAQNLTLSAQISVEQYRASINGYQRALNTLLGEMPTAIITTSKGFDEIRMPNTPPRMMPAWIIENRPDVIEAYYKLMQSNAIVGIAVAKRYPSLSISADGGILYSILSNGTYNSMPFVWKTGFQILEPLFQWGVNKRNVDIAKLSNKADYLTFEQTVLNAFQEVETSLGNINALEQQIMKLKELVSINAQTASMNSDLFKAGSVNYINLLDAQREFFSSQQELISTQTSLLNNYVALYKAFGSGWE